MQFQRWKILQFVIYWLTLNSLYIVNKAFPFGGGGGWQYFPLFFVHFVPSQFLFHIIPTRMQFYLLVFMSTYTMKCCELMCSRSSDYNIRLLFDVFTILKQNGIESKTDQNWSKYLKIMSFKYLYCPLISSQIASYLKYDLNLYKYMYLINRSVGYQFHENYMKHYCERYHENGILENL